jgi:serine/threonine protein kinase
MEDEVQLASTPALYHNKALPIGSLLREWRLEGVVGVGGFGIVYRAKGVYFNETVAIKEYFPGAISDRVGGTTVAPTNSATEELYALGLDKFVEEAKLLWGLSQPKRHPNIVSVRSLFEMHGTAYSVMDFEDGQPLAELLSAGRRFDETALMKLLRPLADGLSLAHEAGVVHRDIKPANILIREDGAPVLIDFGSARFASSEATSTSITFYTPPYAALEQYVRSYAQGPWTDIYALGVVLSQCITGRKPAEVLERLDGGSGELLGEGHCPGFSRSFTRAVDAAMAVRPTERPQSMAEWLALFDQASPSPNEALTRIQSYLEFEVARFDEPSPPRVQDGLPDPPVRKRSAMLSAVNRRPRLLAGAVLGLALGMLALAGTLGRQPGGMVVSPTSPPATRSAGLHRASPGAAAAAVITSLDQLSAEVAAVAPPPQFVTSLASARTSIQARASAIRKLDDRPGGEMLGAQLMASLRGEVAALVQQETDTLSSQAETHVGQTRAVLGAGGAARVEAAYATFRQSSLALIARSHKSSPADLVDAGRQLLVQYGAFDQVYRDASKQFLPVRRRVFEAGLYRGVALAKRIAASGNVSKPWFFAPQVRKAAYQQLQAAAQSARSQQVQLALLARRAATDDLAELDRDIYKASTIDRELALGASVSSRARLALR